MLWKKTIALVQTPGLPPNQGRMNLASKGCTKKSRKEPVKIVAANNSIDWRGCLSWSSIQATLLPQKGLPVVVGALSGEVKRFACRCEVLLSGFQRRMIPTRPESGDAPLGSTVRPGLSRP